jgi:hypothetical protein
MILSALSLEKAKLIFPFPNPWGPVPLPFFLFLCYNKTNVSFPAWDCFPSFSGRNKARLSQACHHSFQRFTITVILFILPYFTEKEKPVFLN